MARVSTAGLCWLAFGSLYEVSCGRGVRSRHAVSECRGLLIPGFVESAHFQRLTWGLFTVIINYNQRAVPP